MINYTYKCFKCGYSHDFLFNMGEASKNIVCNKCGDSMKRDFSQTIIKIPYNFHESTFNYDTSPSSSYGVKKRFAINNNPLVS